MHIYLGTGVNVYAVDANVTSEVYNTLHVCCGKLHACMHGCNFVDY